MKSGVLKMDEIDEDMEFPEHDVECTGPIMEYPEGGEVDRIGAISSYFSIDQPSFLVSRMWNQNDIVQQLSKMANCNMEHLERELICPLCNDYFTTPLLLPCNHNVCHRCAKSQLGGTSGRCSFHASNESLQSTDTNHETTPTSSGPGSAASASRKSRKTSLTSLSSTPTSPLDLPGGGFNTATRSSMRRSFRERKSVTGTGPIAPRDKVRANRRISSAGTESPRPESPIYESPRTDSPRPDLTAGTPETPRGRKGSTGSLSSLSTRSDSFSGNIGMRGRTSSTGKLNGPTATSIHCPTCDEEVGLGDKGINGLFRNFALEVVVDRYKLAAKKAASIPCGSCKKRPPEDAAKSCLDCKSPYCTECFAIHHPWGTPRAQHVCIGPTYNYRPKTLMCNEHHGEKITMYCEGCHKPICHRCKFSGAHADHKVSIIERKYTAMKEKMEQTIAAIAKRRHNITSQVEKLEQISTSIDASSEAMQKALAEAFELLQSTLNEKQTGLTQRAADEVSQRTQNIRQMLDTYKNVLQGCSVADLASELLKETDKAMFVQAAKPLVGRLVQTARSLKQTEEMCENYETFGNFILDSTTALKSLRDLNFIQAPGQPVLQHKSSNRGTFLEWTPSADGGVAESFSVEFTKVEKKHQDESLERPTSLPLNTVNEQGGSESDDEWTRVSDLTEFRFEPEGLEMNASYKFRVKACNQAGSKSSESLLLRTPPAPGLPFKWVQCQSSLPHTSTKVGRDGQEVVVSPTSTMFTSNSSSFPTSPIALEPVHFVGDKKLTSGKHYWEVLVNNSTLAVHIGVASERMAERFSQSNGVDAIADRDSGHDSCDELDDEVSLQDPTVFVTHCMGKLTLPSPTTSTPRKNSSKAKVPSPRSCNIQSNVIGVLLDADAGKVSFYDGTSKECLFTRKIKVSGVIQPAITIVGSGSITMK